MALEQTLSIIKPDAVAKNVIGDILKTFEDNNLKIIALKMTQLTQEQAENFYDIHKDKPFFNELVEYMISGPVVVSVLEGENAVALHRELMGATDPKEAKENTIRAKYGEHIGRNAVHGSDSLENANREINFFFPNL